MSIRLARSATLIAADTMLNVHDTFLSEMMLTREQLQNGRSKELLVLLARFTQQNREYSRAQEYLKEAIDFDREDLSVWTMLGSFQYAAGEYNKALASFEQFLSLAEDPDPEVCVRLGLVYISLGKYEKAYHLLIHAVQKVEIAIAWTALGVCCLRMNDFGEAEVALQQANEMDRWDPTTWGYCAVTCARMGRWIEGEQAVWYTARLGLRDYRLIREILEFYEDVAKGEETRIHLRVLRLVNVEECHKPMEPENAGKGMEMKEDEGIDHDDDDDDEV
jgi:tetratricopeptide (TPR) repeat protein